MDIEVSLKTSKTCTESDLHILPCKINYTGPAEVSKYLIIDEFPNENGSEQVTLETTFRGHHLKCNPTELPNEYAGFVYDDAPNPLNLVKNDVFFDMMNDDAEAKRFWKPTSSFKRINVWGHDFPADKDSDPYFCVPSLVNLSEALCKNPSNDNEADKHNM